MEEHVALLKEKEKEEFDENDATNAESRNLLIVCGNSAAQKLMIWTFIMVIGAGACGIAVPLLGASWFGNCVEDDGRTIIDDSTICEPNYRLYNLVSTIFRSIGALLRFLSNGFLGRLTDSFGRKLFIGLCFLSYAPSILLIVFYPNFYIYFALSIFIDLPYFVYEAYVADIFSDSILLKTVAYSVFSAITAFGLFFGSFLALVVSLFYDNHTVFVVVGIMYAFLIPFWCFCFDETLSKKDRKAFVAKNYNPLRPLFRVFDNKVITYCSIYSFFSYFEDSAILSTILSFVGDQFNMKDGNETNLIFVLVSVSGGIGGVLGGIVINPMLKKYKVRNIIIIIIGNVITVIGLLGMGISVIFYEYRYEIFITGTFLYGTGSIAYPACLGIASHYLQKNEQGTGLGIIKSYASIGGIFAPALMGWLYFEFTNENGIYLPSIVYYICVSTKLVSLLINIGPFYSLLQKMKQNRQEIGSIATDATKATSEIEMEIDQDYYLVPKK